jgi:tetratricopeptide (TPR) repeat protein
MAYREGTPAANRSPNTFRWTRALQAMIVVLLRWAAWGRQKSSLHETVPSVEGHRGSMAASIDAALSKNVSSWIDSLFGSTDEDRPVLELLIDRSNREFKNHPDQPVVLSLNTHQLSPQNIHLFFNEKKLKTPSEMLALAEQLTNEWKKGASQKDRSTPKSLDSPTPSPDRPVRIVWPFVGEHFVGREKEIEQLDVIWSSRTVGVVSIVAEGGVGKSALVKYWLDGMAQEGYRGAQRIFAWTFYQQGLSHSHVISDADFIDEMLRWCGDTNPNQGTGYEKGERLARLLLRQRTLLLLDGLEPLQYPPGPNGGRLKSGIDGVKSLLMHFATQGRPTSSLCILTTRYPLTDLNGSPKTTTILELTHLTPQAGSALLRKTLPDANTSLLERAAQLLDGHALALSLLGPYVRDVWKGNLHHCLNEEPWQLRLPCQEEKNVSRLPHKREINWSEADQRKGSPARKVMDSYVRWFGEGPELAVLRMLGLFDRPAQAGEIASIRDGEEIEGLTQPLFSQGTDLWSMAVHRLREARLLAIEDRSDWEVYDTHPLIRDYFARQLQEDFPQAWREGHRRLYGYHKQRGLARERLHPCPECLEDLLPWYIAIPHGCYAGEHCDALVEVYRQRILRDTGDFSTSVLGAVGADYAVLSSFFEEPFEKVATHLNAYPELVLFLLHQVGYCLRALGRLDQAVRCSARVLQCHQANQNWGKAALEAGLMSQIFLSMGELTKAVEYGQQAVHYSDQGDLVWERMKQRSALNYMKYQAGQIPNLDANWQETVSLRQSLAQEDPTNWTGQVYTLLSFFHEADYQIDQGTKPIGKIVDQLQRATKQYVQAMEGNPNAATLMRVVLGRASMHPSNRDPKQRTQADSFWMKAVETGRKSGREDVLPLALLGRAEYYCQCGKFEEAWSDVRETLALSERCGMRLYQADALLCATRLSLEGISKKNRSQRIATASETLRQAQQKIDEMGYFRRYSEVQALTRRIAELTGSVDSKG